MLKKICLLFFLILSTAAIAQDEFDPGFGEEGSGDAADAPNVPIDGILIPLFISGLLLSIYVLRKKENQLN